MFAIAQPLIAGVAAPRRATAPLLRSGPATAAHPNTTTRAAILVSSSDANEKMKTNRATPLIAAAIAAAVAMNPVDAYAATVFAGKYVDPNHPHCPREISDTGRGDLER